MSTTVWFWTFTTIYAASALISFFVLFPIANNIGWDDLRSGKMTLLGAINWFASVALFVLAYRRLGENEWLVFLSMATGIASAIALTFLFKALMEGFDALRNRRTKPFHGARTTTR